MAKKKRDYSRDAAGNRLPSVTEIIGKHLGWKAQGLYGYFYKRGKEGLPMNAHRDAAASRGSCCHDLVAAHYAPDEHGDLSEWTEAQIEEAKPNALRVIAEITHRGWTVLFCETPMESESFAGTLDIVVRTKEGAILIVDLKTSAGAYDETVIQLGSYAWLWRIRCIGINALDLFATEAAVIHAPYGSDLSVLPVNAAALLAGEQAFRLLLQIHQIQPQIKLGDAA